MDRKTFFLLAEKIIEGYTPTPEEYRELSETPDAEVMRMLSGADLLRENAFGREVQLCTICNGKSGRCSEDCRFCAQSGHYQTDASTYPLMEEETLVDIGANIAASPVNRFSIVTTGRGLPADEVARVARALEKVKSAGIETCASLGVLGEEEIEMLRAAGVGRYHHNLETAGSHFAKICTTHSFDHRVETIRQAKRAGLTVCSGGIFGIGETDAQVLEMALTLKELSVDAVPVNFLVPIPGTPFEGFPGLSPLRCLKIIALFRYVLPAAEVIVCGGREDNLKELHPLVFLAGASGIMTGNYLTAAGRRLEDDLALIERLGFSVRKKAPGPKPGRP
jgi:biotin synthase